MNWKHIWELTKINLLYSNPQALVNVRKKNAKRVGKAPKAAYKTILMQQGFTILLYSFIFIYLFSSLNYSEYPGYFSFQLFVFFMMSVTSAFSVMFSVFYNSHDTKLYLPLPVTEKEIYIAKLLSSVGLNLTFLMPTLSLLMIGYQSILGNLLVALPLALLQFAVLAGLSITLSVFLVHFLGKLLMKARHKNMISTGLMLLSTFGAVAMILFMQSVSLTPDVEAMTIPDLATIPLFVGFYHVAFAPFSLPSLLHYWPLIILLIVFTGIVLKVVIPQYYRQLAVIDTKKATVRKKKSGTHGLQTTLILHHMGTIKDPTLIMTSVMASFMFVMFFLPMILEGSKVFAMIPLELFGLVFLAGLALGYFTSGGFTMVGMSVERDNFYFLKALPLNFPRFLRQKFWVLWFLQTSIPLLVFGVLALLAGLSLPHLIAFLLGILASSYPASLWAYKYDYKHLTLNWQNISQLFNRGGGQLVKMLLLLLTLVVTGAIGVGLFFLAFLIGPWITSIGTVVVSCAIVIGLHFYYEKTFWQQLN